MDDENCSSHGSEIDDMEVDDLLDPSFTYPEEFSDAEENEEDDYDDEEDISLVNSDLNFVKFKIISNTETYIRYENKERITRPYITKFERTKILGTRAAQIEGGAKVLLQKSKLKKARQAIQIAELEYQEKLIPFIIRRYLPSGQYEDWKFSDFHNI